MFNREQFEYSLPDGWRIKAWKYGADSIEFKILVSPRPYGYNLVSKKTGDDVNVLLHWTISNSARVTPKEIIASLNKAVKNDLKANTVHGAIATKI